MRSSRESKQINSYKQPIKKMIKITKILTVFVFLFAFSATTNAQTSNKNFDGFSIEVGVAHGAARQPHGARLLHKARAHGEQMKNVVVVVVVAASSS